MSATHTPGTVEPAHEAQERYDGPATLVTDLLTDGGEVAVEVVLRAAFQPLDGRMHWWGRVSCPSTGTVPLAPGTSVVLRTPYGEAAARLSDPDPWGRLRATGTGRPPF